MQIKHIVLTGLLGFGLGFAARTPALLQMREDRDDARRALEAIGPQLLVQSPPEVEREFVFLNEQVVPNTGADYAGDEEVSEEIQEQVRPERTPRTRRQRDPSRDDPEVREQRMQEFTERMRGWADESKLSFIERAELDDAQTQQLDMLVYELNQSAASIVEEWSKYVREVGGWNADYGIRFAHDLGTALVAAYDAMDESLGDWRSAAGDFNMMRMLDPEVLRPMTELQREMGGRGGGMFGFGSGFMRGGRGGGFSRGGNSRSTSRSGSQTERPGEGRSQ